MNQVSQRNTLVEQFLDIHLQHPGYNGPKTGKIQLYKISEYDHIQVVSQSLENLNFCYQNTVLVTLSAELHANCCFLTTSIKVLRGESISHIFYQAVNTESKATKSLAA